MPLKVSSPYPLHADLAAGHAVVRVSSPHQRAFHKVNEELVAEAREHAREWDEFAETLEALMAHGWSPQSHGGLLATRPATADELPAVAAAALGEGLAVQWCAVDADLWFTSDHLPGAHRRHGSHDDVAGRGSAPARGNRGRPRRQLLARRPGRERDPARQPRGDGPRALWSAHDHARSGSDDRDRRLRAHRGRLLLGPPGAHRAPG